MDLSSVDITSPNLGKEYTLHSVFDQLSDFINFYDMLSYTTMAFVSSGVIGVINLNKYLCLFFNQRNSRLNKIGTD
mgnify:CR=1 FL=1